MFDTGLLMAASALIVMMASDVGTSDELEGVRRLFWRVGCTFAAVGLVLMGVAIVIRIR